MLFAAFRILSIGARCDHLRGTEIKLRISFQLFVYIVFIVFQVLDGVFTYYGVTHTKAGMNYEANPILIFYMNLIGVTETVVVAKSVAIILGTIMYFEKIRLTLGCLLFLNIFYLPFIVAHVLVLTRFFGFYN